MNNSYENVLGSRWKGYFLTAYGIAVKHGFKGTEADWLLSLTAYGIALELGFVGTKAEWIASLKGEKGDPFTFYDFTEEQLEELKTAIAGAVLADAKAARDEAVDAVTAVNNIVQEVEKAKEDANSYYLQAEYQAGEADRFARAAEESMNDASDYASDALGSAQSADASALSAAESARNAAQNAVDVKKNCANALRGQLFGASVSADDVLPIEHELDIKVSSKNLFDISKVGTYKAGGSNSNPCVSGYGIINNGDGTLTVYTHDTVTSAYLSNNGTLRDFAPDLKVGETYTLDATSIKANGEASAAQRIYLNQAKTTWLFKKSLTITAEMLSSRVHWYVDTAIGADQVATISNIQIEKGTLTTAYTPYINVEGKNVTVTDGENSQTATADADGNVKGLMSMSPSMTLTTDNAGAVVECTYNRDTNKVIENLTNAIISLGGNI